MRTVSASSSSCRLPAQWEPGAGLAAEAEAGSWKLKAGSSRTHAAHPARAGPTVRPEPVGAGEVRRPGRRAAGLGRARLARVRDPVVAADPGALGYFLRKTLYPSLLGACGRQRRVRARRGDAASAEDPHRRRRGDRRQLPAGREGGHNRGITIGSGVFVGRNTILSCKNGDIDLEDGANIGFNCEVFSASQVRIGRDTLLAAYCYVIGGDHDFSDASRAGPRAGADVGGRADRRRRLARRGRQGPRRRDDRRSRGDRRRRAGARGGAGRRHRGRRPGADRRATRSGGPGMTAPPRAAQAERAAGLRPSRLGGVAHARREAAVRVDDSALRSRPLQRVAGQPAQEGPVRGDARRARHRHHLPAQVASSIRRRCRRCSR